MHDERLLSLKVIMHYSFYMVKNFLCDIVTEFLIWCASLKFKRQHFTYALSESVMIRCFAFLSVCFSVHNLVDWRRITFTESYYYFTDLWFRCESIITDLPTHTILAHCFVSNTVPYSTCTNTVL